MVGMCKIEIITHKSQIQNRVDLFMKKKQDITWASLSPQIADSTECFCLQ